MFTPVLAKHSKSFSLIDRISVAVDRMQRNFEQRSELPTSRRSGGLPPSDVTTQEGLPVTTEAKSAMGVLETTTRLGLARQAIKDARKQGYFSAAESQRLTRQLSHHMRTHKARQLERTTGPASFRF